MITITSDSPGRIKVTFAVRTAVHLVGIAKPVNVHTFRHSFATHLLESTYDRDVPRKSRQWRTQGVHNNLGSYLSGKPRPEGIHIRTVQELLGHKDVSTTMIYTHVLNKPGISLRSPLDW